MVRAAGIEPARGFPQRIFLPPTAFTAAPSGVWGLDYTFTLALSRLRRRPSSLYTFPEEGLGSGLPFHRFPRIWAVLHSGFPRKHSNFLQVRCDYLFRHARTARGTHCVHSSEF